MQSAQAMLVVDTVTQLVGVARLAIFVKFVRFKKYVANALYLDDLINVKATIATLSADLATLSDELEKVKKETSQLNTAIDGLKKAIADVKAEMVGNNEPPTLFNMKTTIATLSADVATLSDELEKVTLQLNTDIVGLKKVIADAKAEMGNNEPPTLFKLKLF